MYKTILLLLGLGTTFHGCDGAKTGAAIGTVVAVMTKGKQIEIPANY